MHPDSWESEQTQHAHNAPWFVFHGKNGKIAKNGLWLPAPSSIHRCVKRQTFLRKMKICLRKASPAGGRPRLGTAQAGGWLGGCVCGWASLTFPYLTLPYITLFVVGGVGVAYIHLGIYRVVAYTHFLDF